MTEVPRIENHPLKPFVPENARLLMLGSFPPQKKRWCVDFYYPNFTNDMWRIFGLLYFNSKDALIDVEAKRFNLDLIIPLLNDKGIAIYDTATRIRRLKDNASDKYLEVVESTDLVAMTRDMPFLKAIVTTGAKATEVLSATFHSETPKMGEYACLQLADGRTLRHYRMPSSSRAYPLALAKKTNYYASMMQEIGLL